MVKDNENLSPYDVKSVFIHHSPTDDFSEEGAKIGPQKKHTVPAD